MKNPNWQAAEDKRLAAEDAYSTFMKSKEGLLMREDKPLTFRKKVEELNAAITAANREVRLAGPEDLEEEEG